MIVRLGPFSELHYSLLKEKLEAGGADFARVEDPELVQAYLAARKNVEVHIHPAYSGSLPEYIFLDVQKEHLLLIKRDLDALGFSLVQASEVLLDDQEVFMQRPKTSLRRYFYILLFFILFIFILMRSSI